MQPETGLSHTPQAAPILLEPSLFYDPPYDRPLEDEFAWHLVKYLSPVTALSYQVKVETACANVWVDFVVEHGGRRIGFECGELDGSTDEGSSVDEPERLRAALILGTGQVDVLYRFQGHDLVHRLHDCLLLVARWDPDLFSTRGQVNLDTLASPEARAHRPLRHETVARIACTPAELAAEDEDVYEGEPFAWPAAEAEAVLVVHRLSRDNPAAWIRDYDRALAHYGVSDDDLGTRWAKTA
jgi:hypothetical protein